MSGINVFDTDQVSNDELFLSEEFNGDFVTINPYELLQNEINSFSSLKLDWDGYGGIPVMNSIVDIASNFVTCLDGYYIEKTSDIYPNPHGTITIEWENSKGEKLSLEVGEKNYSYFIKYLNKAPKTINGTGIVSNVKSIASDLDELFNDEVPKYFFP